MCIGTAVFDFDQTLIRQESLAMFLQTMAGGRYVSAYCAAGVKAVMTASSGERLNVFRTEMFRRTLAGKPVAQAQEAARRVFARLDWIGATMEALARHKDRGRCILVATGSLSVYMPALLELKGIRVDGLLATEIGIEGSVFTGEMATASCTGTEKARRVREWLAGIDDGPVWGYGNLPHDRAMLALTDYPTVVPG
ncbi:MAG: HAD-superfamily hydrolase [Rhodospirillaceae bacterium]|nr:MAG: HAD-superfamily hydrolase [Rhodospirillaceae bacterium]